MKDFKTIDTDTGTAGIESLNTWKRVYSVLLTEWVSCNL